jgi:CDK-activating kinase assembly factor MAT1
MSRKPVSSVVKPSSAPSAALPSDLCPVCKRVRYLNTDMEFLINPECYHPMCSNCVNNIFKSGPAQCPYASCTKTLRQKGFRSAFFGDLTVEREVDIRRRVAAVFNKAEDDFVTLRDYNDYLQSVEELSFSLISGGEEERRRAEQDLLAYEQAHKADIERNRRKGRDAESARRRRDAAEAEAARLRRQEEQDDERRIREEEAKVRDEVMEALARGEPGSASEIQERILARKRDKLASLSNYASLLDAGVGANGSGAPSMLSIRGLKAQGPDAGEVEDDGPYDPFGGLNLEPTRYAVAESYDNPWLRDARSRDDHRVPGYDVHEYVARAMFEAFAGLGVVVEDEKAAAQRAVGTAGAESAAAS